MSQHAPRDRDQAIHYAYTHPYAELASLPGPSGQDQNPLYIPATAVVVNSTFRPGSVRPAQAHADRH